MAQRPDTQLDTASPFGSRAPDDTALAAWRRATSRDLTAAQRKAARAEIAHAFAGPYDVEADGIRLRAYPLENHCDRMVLGRAKLPESDERELIAPLLRPGMTFVDIGANVGVYTLFVSARTGRTGGMASVLAFEPNPRTFAKLEFNCRANGFGSVRLINAAVGASEGNADLFLESTGNAGSATMVAGGTAVPSVAIRTTTLLAALERAGMEHIDLLKIDVEGYEDAALLPFFRTAPRGVWPGHLLLETVHEARWRENLSAFLREAGYAPEGATDENVLLRR